MAQADYPQSLSKREDEFLRRFSLRKFTVPIEGLSKKEIGSNRPKSGASNSDLLPQKRYRIEYKELKRALKVDIPWWLRAKGLEDDMNTERLVTLVEESVERICSSKRLVASREVQKVVNSNGRGPQIAQVPIFTEFCSSQEKSVISLTSCKSIQFIDGLSNLAYKSNDEEVNEISCVEMCLSRVIRILQNLEGTRLDSGCEKCQCPSVTSDALAILSNLSAEKSCEIMDEVPNSSPMMRKNLCICNLENVDNEIGNLCNYIATIMKSRSNSNDSCNYISILQRVQMLRKSLEEITRKVMCSEEAGFRTTSPEMLRNTNEKTKSDSKKGKDKKNNKTDSNKNNDGAKTVDKKTSGKKSKQEKLKSTSSKKGELDEFPCCQYFDLMKNKQGNYVTCKAVQTDYFLCSVPRAASTRKPSVERETQPSEIKGHMNKQTNIACCCKEVQTNSHGTPMLVPCLIFQQVPKKLSSSFHSVQEESFEAADKTDLENQFTASYLRCKAEEALNNINFYKDVGNFVCIGKSCQCSKREEPSSITPGVNKVSDDKNPGCCWCKKKQRTTTEKNNSSSKKPKTIKKSKSDLDQRKLQLNDESMVKEIQYGSADELVVKGDGNIECVFKVASDMKVSYTTEPEANLKQNETDLNSLSQKGEQIKCECEIPLIKVCENGPKNSKSPNNFPIKLLHHIHIEKITPAKDSKERKLNATKKRCCSCSCLPLCRKSSPSKQESIMSVAKEKSEPEEKVEERGSRTSFRKEISNISLAPLQECESADSSKSRVRVCCSCIALAPKNSDSKSNFSQKTTKRSNSTISTVRSFKSEKSTNVSEFQQGMCTCCAQKRSSISTKNVDRTSEKDYICCRPCSNFCNECMGIDIPIITHDLAGAIRKIIGNRRRNSVFLKFTMVGGNLFHVQMCTDNDYLGCLYATQSATFKARDTNGFDGCITLCVTDTSNTLMQIENLVDHAFMVVQQEKRCSF